MSEVGIIHVVDGEQAGQDVKLPADDKKFTIGRRSNCDLMLRVDSISREHCYIQRQGDDYWLYDNGSANATLLNGMAIEKAKLVHGDVLTLDRVTLEYLSPSQTPGTREMIREFVVSKGAGSQQTYTAENSLLGKTVDSYKLLSVLGEGGMAMVYKARNEKDQSLVAVKFLKGGPQADRENTARFLKEFKKATGSTPYQLILRMKLEHAASLLTGTNDTISGIAYSLGFADQSHFTHAFIKKYGVSPGRYRSNFLQQ
ncbi:MAG: helix-turn-helix domain-containing protein [Ignavibacteriaceae bacterium]|nr:helix-turn-helix domain-containing protein [Ignavibacteriaceae bacterium]